MNAVPGRIEAAPPTVSASSSADLYMCWSCAAEIASGRIETLAPTVYRAGETLIVIRHLSGLLRLPAHDRLILVVDDDWHGGLTDGNLSLPYRLKLAAVERRDALRLERRADVIAVASDRLARLYARRGLRGRILRIDPAWPVPVADPGACVTAEIAYLGSRAHAGDMAMVERVVEACLSARPGLRVVIAGGHGVPRRWRGRANIAARPERPWPEYLEWLRVQRFHVVLYPLVDGVFNAARSVNKLLEAAQVGGALLASERWGAADRLRGTNRCVLLGDNPQDWAEAAVGLLESPHGAAGPACSNQAAILGDPPLDRQRHLWQQLLGAETV